MSDPNGTTPNAGPWNGGPPGSAPGGTGPSGDPAGPGGPSSNWRDMRRSERDTRRQWRHEMRWNSGGLPIGGLIVLTIGVVFLLGNFGFHIPGQWWSVLILIPAVGLLVTAIRFYRVDGPRSPRVIGPAIGGGMLLALALAIFFGLNWGLFWPIVLVVVGLAIVGRRLTRNR